MAEQVYWIGVGAPGRLGISLRPRGGDWLTDDVKAWRATGVDTVVSLLTQDEVTELELQQEPILCQAAGIKFYSMPIPDRGLPTSRAEIERLVAVLLRDLRGSRTVVVHCRHGIGRSSLMAASVLVAAGEAPDAALSAIQAARGRPVPDTEEQAGWIRAYPAA
ncbi:MAG: dual specificity protein phosphatase family protein [Deltaproteobacteria bacterium]|nr:dual specificity protein phosphatase family protein [Deltaproteobacteria bacterium]